MKESELQVLRSQYLKEQEAEHITVQTKFNYAWGLVKSEVHNNQLEGVRLLTGLPHAGAKAKITEIYKESSSRRRECLYYLALGQYKLGHYNEARRFNDVLLEREPRNMQALSLKALIDERVARGLVPDKGVLISRGVCGYGDCWERDHWIHCCSCDVVKATVTLSLTRIL